MVRASLCEAWMGWPRTRKMTQKKAWINVPVRSRIGAHSSSPSLPFPISAWALSGAKNKNVSSSSSNKVLFSISMHTHLVAERSEKSNGQGRVEITVEALLWWVMSEKFLVVAPPHENNYIFWLVRDPRKSSPGQLFLSCSPGSVLGKRTSFSEIHLVKQNVIN